MLCWSHQRAVNAFTPTLQTFPVCITNDDSYQHLCSSLQDTENVNWRYSKFSHIFAQMRRKWSFQSFKRGAQQWNTELTLTRARWETEHQRTIRTAGTRYDNFSCSSKWPKSGEMQSKQNSSLNSSSATSLFSVSTMLIVFKEKWKFWHKSNNPTCCGSLVLCLTKQHWDLSNHQWSPLNSLRWITHCQRGLEFNQLSVFQDVARAMNYFHYSCHDPIIHRDISAPTLSSCKLCMEAEILGSLIS